VSHDGSMPSYLPEQTLNSRIKIYYLVILMISDELGKVGSKGELYPSTRMRKALHLTPNTKVLYRISPRGYLIVEIVHSVKDLLKAPRLTKANFEEMEAISERMQEKGQSNGS